MPLILIAEDDLGTSRLAATALRNQGHEVLTAPDGLSAWRLIEMRSPNLVVSDVNMPGMNGHELLSRLRAHPRLALTPLILLTSLQERKDMRHGMSLGANDYLTKPLRPKELIEAVNVKFGLQQRRETLQADEVKNALAQALEQQAWDLHEQYEQRLARELSEQWPQDNRHEASTLLDNASVIWADIRHYQRWLEALAPHELSRVLKRFYEHCGDTLHLFGVTALYFGGEGLVAVYADSPDGTHGAPHGLRALKAAHGLQKTTAAMNAFVEEHRESRRLPNFEVGVALHQGPVALTRLEGLLGGAAQLIPVGATVAQARTIRRLAPRVAGALTVSDSPMRSLKGQVKILGRYAIPWDIDRAPLEVCAVQPMVRTRPKPPRTPN